MKNSKILCIILILCCNLHKIKSQPTIMPLSKSIKFIVDHFEATPDTVYIKEFRRISDDDNIYDCVIVKDIKAFYIDVIINQVDKDKEMYKINNMEGCSFLSNPLLNRVFHGFYQHLLVNHSDPLKCPVKSGSYLFRNAFNKAALPQMHPRGNFSLNIYLKSNTFDETMLNLKWLYRLVKA
ncbi:uncharacterized protein LOC142240687 [Haematobia irritans]|uniref:uncharacterized protein LOC142240687 n=1 Tax=Haematobia irritans TaxID=7368 RepID=UPI003F50086F